MKEFNISFTPAELAIIRLSLQYFNSRLLESMEYVSSEDLEKDADTASSMFAAMNSAQEKVNSFG